MAYRFIAYSSLVFISYSQYETVSLTPFIDDNMTSEITSAHNKWVINPQYNYGFFMAVDMNLSHPTPLIPDTLTINISIPSLTELQNLIFSFETGNQTTEFWSFTSNFQATENRVYPRCHTALAQGDIESIMNENNGTRMDKATDNNQWFDVPNPNQFAENIVFQIQFIPSDHKINVTFMYTDMECEYTSMYFDAHLSMFITTDDQIPFNISSIQITHNYSTLAPTPNPTNTNTDFLSNSTVLSLLAVIFVISSILCLLLCILFCISKKILLLNANGNGNLKVKSVQIGGVSPGVSVDPRNIVSEQRNLAVTPVEIKYKNDTTPPSVAYGDNINSEQILADIIVTPGSKPVCVMALEDIQSMDVDNIEPVDINGIIVKTELEHKETDDGAQAKRGEVLSVMSIDVDKIVFDHSGQSKHAHKESGSVTSVVSDIPSWNKMNSKAEGQNSNGIATRFGR